MARNPSQGSDRRVNTSIDTAKDIRDETAETTRTWVRAAVFAAAALAILLVGATIGLLIGRSETMSGPTDPKPGPVDIGFSQDMSVHHQQAVEMGNIVRDRSSDPEVRQLGYDIATTQLGQIGRMQGWLTLWDAPEQATGELMTWMPGEHGHGTDSSESADAPPMPGMADRAEMKKLRSLSGDRLDAYFLQLMLRHHQGGASMAEYTAERANVPAVQALAQSMVNSQGAEMEMMKRMLAAREVKPLPFG